MTEEEPEKLQGELASTVKRLPYLEMKTDDLENLSRGKNLHLQEGADDTQSLLDFMNVTEESNMWGKRDCSSRYRSIFFTMEPSLSMCRISQRKSRKGTGRLI